MQYAKTKSAVFMDRPNRFEAHVEVDGVTELVHVKNTGRCRELLLPGSKVTLALAENPQRKTRYDLISVWKNDLGWVNIDSQIPNVVVREWLESNPTLFPDINCIHPEYVYRDSRIDFLLECGTRRILMEVKGCTLEVEGTGYFPDAPTERGIKHLNELAYAVGEGFECYLAFVIAMPGIREVRPNMETHAAFGEALDTAKKAGVKVLYLPCEVGADQIRIIPGKVTEGL